MKKTITLLMIVFFAVQNISANINHIDISKISKDLKLVSAFNFIKEKKQFYDHWTNDWRYDIPKQELINKLRDNYNSFSALSSKNEELYLLLGDIAHYLYNMDDTTYFKMAVDNYNIAIEKNPNDYRAFWFLGYHYALSNEPASAIDNFIKADNLLSSEKAGDFWNDYAWTSAAANMPSHCIYAMDKVKSITGKAGDFELQFGESIHKRIIPIDRDSSYNKLNIWAAGKNESDGSRIIFTSRPLGMKLIIDTIWNMSIYDYQNRQSAFIITPESIANKQGKEISYTIAIVMMAANEKDYLDDYINKILAKYQTKTKTKFSDKYDKMVAYEIKENNMYQDMGGGHLFVLGIERDDPKYPGFRLEAPEILPKSNGGEITYYSATDSRGRFKGKLFYVIMLDSCEDIYEMSFKKFKDLFDNQIIIE